MEHIIQFGITIDDDAIKKHIEEKATKQVADSITQSVKDKIFKHYGSGFTYDAQEMFGELLDKYKDEIIANATAQIVDSIKRSKKYKEALAKVAEEMISE